MMLLTEFYTDSWETEKIPADTLNEIKKEFNYLKIIDGVHQDLSIICDEQALRYIISLDFGKCKYKLKPLLVGMNK